MKKKKLIKKYNQLLNDYEKLKKDFKETYNAYCNVSELARQYNELARKAEDRAGLYEDSYESEHSAIHHQIEINEILDEQNRILQSQIKALKIENSELRATAGDWQRAYELNKPIEYNYKHWQPDNSVSSWIENLQIGTTVISPDVADNYEEFVQDVLDLDQ